MPCNLLTGSGADIQVDQHASRCRTCRLEEPSPNFGTTSERLRVAGSVECTTSGRKATGGVVTDDNINCHNSGQDIVVDLSTSSKELIQLGHVDVVSPSEFDLEFAGGPLSVNDAIIFRKNHLWECRDMRVSDMECSLISKILLK